METIIGIIILIFIYNLLFGGSKKNKGNQRHSKTKSYQQQPSRKKVSCMYCGGTGKTYQTRYVYDQGNGLGRNKMCTDMCSSCVGKGWIMQ